MPRSHRSTASAALGVLLAAATIAPLGAQEKWTEDFESYASGSMVHGQGLWRAWDDDPTWDAEVTDLVASSGDQSLRIADSSDMVLRFAEIPDLPPVDSGYWVIKAQTYVPADQIGSMFFILLNRYVDGSANPKNWSVQVGMSAETLTVSDNGGSAGGPVGSGTLPLIPDEWVEIRVEVDLDRNEHSIYYGGQLLSATEIWAGGDNHEVALGAMDLWSDLSTDSFIDDVSVERVCRPLHVQRTVGLSGSALVEGVDTPVHTEDGVATVSLALSDLRAEGDDCPELGDVTIVETLPEGWTPIEIREGGTFEDGKITWSFPADLLGEGQITYRAMGPYSFSNVDFVGTVAEAGIEEFTHVAGLTVPTDKGLGRDGVIHSWLMLGPFGHTGGNPPPADVIESDHLTDGIDIYEDEVEPEEGDEVETDFEFAASTELGPSPNPDINPAGVPAWYPWLDAGGNIDLGGANLYGALDNVMNYAVCYVCVEEDVDAVLWAGSDDSIQILVDGESYWTNSIARGWPGYVDRVPVELTAGRHILMVKVFEIGGGWNFGVRITDSFGAPFTEGVEVTLDPGGCEGPVTGPQLVRGDADASGQINITDGIFILNFLFLGGPDPSCKDAADSDDSAAINITDGIYVLNFLFLGGPAPLAPYPECGEDTTEDELDCLSFTPCDA